MRVGVRLMDFKKKREAALVRQGKGFWRKTPCEKHTGRFNLECPACNAKNAEFVPITKSEPAK